MSFTPTGVTGIPTDWGRLMVLVNGTDVTMFRGVPTQVPSWGSSEPFGDNHAVVRFPQISPFETLGTGNLSWLVDWANVDIYLVRPDNSTLALFEGIWASEETRHDQTSQALELHCMGCLYQLDLFRAAPSFPNPADDVDIGDAIWLAGWQRSVLGGRFTMGPQVTTGIEVEAVSASGHFQPVLTGFIQDLLAQATTSDGTNQWTVKLARPRRMTIALKDRTTVNWTVTTGQPGLTVDVSRDFSMAPTSIYGEGENRNGCSWRNNKFPNRSHSDALVWPGGGNITIGETSTRVQDIKQRLYDTGWNVQWGEGTDDEYQAGDANQVTAFQIQNNLTANGQVNQATWDAIFFNGPDPEAVGALARVDPLVRLPSVTPQLYDAYGVGYAENPNFDPHKVHVEDYINFGRLSKAKAIISSNALLIRDQDAGWIGRIELAADPEEGSRWEMQAGQNIKVKEFRGAGPTGKLFHISEVACNHESRTVSLSVDTKARDLLTMAGIRQRDRNTVNTARDPRDVKNRPLTAQPTDAPAWDCESGAGIIPKTALSAGNWTVFRAAVGGTGNIQGVAAATFVPAAFSLALFNRAITGGELDAIGTGNPTDDDYYSNDHFDENSGIVNAWGAGEQMAGYYPGKQTDGSPKTGRLFEYVASYYEPTDPPWIWVCIWCDTSTYISGILYPGLQKNR